jgi:hypothetical protein
VTPAATCVRAPTRLAAICSGPPRPGEKAAAGQRVRRLVDWPAEAGTPLDTVLGLLPPGLVQAIRREFAAVLAAKGVGAKPSPGGRQRPRSAPRVNQLPRRLAAGSTPHLSEQDVGRCRSTRVVLWLHFVYLAGDEVSKAAQIKAPVAAFIPFSPVAVKLGRLGCRELPCQARGLDAFVRK